MARYTKANLVEDLLLQDLFAGATKKAVTQFVEDLFANIGDKVATGDDVAIAGFGKFEKYAKTKDGKPTGQFAAKFRPAKALKEKVSA